MLIEEVVHYLNERIPPAYAEDFDNVGLLLGDPKQQVSGVLITLDTLEAVVEEAITKNCNLIVSFHPIIFSRLKTITGKTYVERVVQKALRHGIGIYATHTALDNHRHGVSNRICEQLGLMNRSILIPKRDTIKKLITFVPMEQADTVREALFNAGAGNIGNYDHCSFNISGTGSFKANEEADPVIGEKGKEHREREIQIGVTYAAHRESEVLKVLMQTHPYEEVAYEITGLHNVNQHIGMGMIGELPSEMNEADFLSFVKERMQTPVIRHSKLLQRPIKRVAVLGGSGSFAISNVVRAKADIFITADLKYHDFFKAEGRLILADIGHYESEQFTKNLLHTCLSEKFPNFAIVLSKTNTNPVTYS